MLGKVTSISQKDWKMVFALELVNYLAFMIWTGWKSTGKCPEFCCGKGEVQITQLGSKEVINCRKGYSILLAILNYFMYTMMIPKGVCEEIEQIIGFNLASKDNTLWVRVLRTKYGVKDQLSNSIARSQCSHLWRSLSKDDPFYCILSDLVTLDGTWNLDLFRVWLSDEMVERIVSIPPPHPDSGLDKSDNWILGYNRCQYSCTPFEAELWGILDGILILLNKGYKRATVQTDSSEVGKTLIDKGLEDSGITILRRVQRIMHSVGQWRVQYVSRERNLIVDRLAKLCLA
ncbi:hypothetical protein Goari_023706 [Gossypium aridum]|uniref:RNase H type-1 domain-containing protein n=1 Tax=Gossypium aridum TaxID=34290 RepID=A0A7J8X554_GOSAI|nr:hypothetical protein [Gossypium aridum]